MKLLKNYPTEAAAYIDKGMLASHDIPTVVVYNSLSDIFPAPGAGNDDVRLYVAKERYREALDLLEGV